MTTLKILGSSSAGNGYILQSEGETLVLELGVHYENYYKALDYKIESIVGVLISHAHS